MYSVTYCDNCVLFLLINFILKIWSGFFRKRSRKYAASSFWTLLVNALSVEASIVEALIGLMKTNKLIQRERSESARKQRS